MKKYSIIPLLLLLFPFCAVPETRADEIAVIQAFLDKKTDDDAVLHSVYMACLALTRTGAEDAVPVLTQLLDDERFSTVARTALANIQGKVATPLPQGLTQDAARLARLLQDNASGLPTLVEALQKESEIPFKMTLRAVLELKSDETGTIVLDNMGDLPVWKQAALVRNLVARKDSAVIVLRLSSQIVTGEHTDLVLAAIEALGEIGDLRAVEVLLCAIGGLNTLDGRADELAEAAAESLKLFSGENFEKIIIAQLNSEATSVRLAALEVIGNRRMTAAANLVKALCRYHDYDDYKIRPAAYRSFAQSSQATAEDIDYLLTHVLFWDSVMRDGESAVACEAVLIMCRRTAEREKAVDVFVEVLKTTDIEKSSFLLDCLFALGGEKAAAAIASVAMGTDDALTDKATQLLGRWLTAEVAPYLIEIAEKHPNERYRNRTLSGYLRVIRQMGLPVDQKVQMAEKAVAVATRDADRQRAVEVLERFQAMMKGTPIFDGQTFDGWEFRGNEQWFRIEDGAIVGGTLEEPIPHNEFLVAKKEYSDFTLRLECKAIGAGCNGGVQFRSFRTPADGNHPNEMIGYQADMTDTANYWGAIYDESRRNRFIAEPPRELIESIFRANDWNEYEIVCRGNNIKLYLNGTLTVDYTEEDDTIPVSGFIGLQIHSGPPSETWYRNIRIEEF